MLQVPWAGQPSPLQFVAWAGQHTRDMDAAEAKRKKITFFKQKETANKALQAAGWKLDSQVLIPPSPDVEECAEQSEGENEDQGGISECQVEESPENN